MRLQCSNNDNEASRRGERAGDEGDFSKGEDQGQLPSQFLVFNGLVNNQQITEVHG